MKYSEVDASIVDRELREAARTALAECSADLGVWPSLVWVRESFDGKHDVGSVKATGFVYPGDSTIYLSAALSLDDVRSTIYHEARHIYQGKTLRCFGDYHRAEEDAEQYAYRKTGRLTKIPHYLVRSR